jgi:RHS repeat-associated protein
MKNPKYYYIGSICALLSLTEVAAQQVSVPEDNIPVPLIPVTPTTVPYPGLDNITGISSYNYIRVETPDFPATTWPSGNNQFIRQTTGYRDGLGRPLQTVAKKGHASGHDIIRHLVYDNSGKETYSYLPFIKPSETSYGLFLPNVNTRMRQFYDQLEPDEQPYSKNDFEQSPSSRLMKQLAPGKSWVGSNRGKVLSYRVNQAGEVRKWHIGTAASEAPISINTYAAGELYVTSVTDEDGHLNLEYKDKFGQVVLKKTQETNNQPAPGHDGYACTYYVYDDMQRLRYVVPPKAVELIDGTWNPSNVPELCYSYYYDTRGRLVIKKVPGKLEEYYIYDNKDRQVMYQDGNLRGQQGSWKFTLFDAQDRPYMSGLYKPSFPEPRTLLQSILDLNTNYSPPYLFYYLNNYSAYKLYPTQIEACTPLSYFYYDDYSQLMSFNFDPSPFSGIGLPANGTVVPSQFCSATKGKLTGTKVKVLVPGGSTGQWLATANYYDENGRLIQTQSETLNGDVETSSNIYYFQGMLWKNILDHRNNKALAIAGTNDGAHTSYRLQTTSTAALLPEGGTSQVKSTTQKIDNGIDYQFGNYFYDHMGRLVTRQAPAANFLQEYNMRGFLNHIQVANFSNQTNSVHIFEENLYYDKGFASKLYNGNIAGITWRKAGVGAPLEAYGYSYDMLNRLNHAEYRREIASNSWSKDDYNYTTSGISYDLNGNLKTMNQWGLNPPAINTPIPMDELEYSYESNSNKLIRVKDAVLPGSTASLPDFKDNADFQEEYIYDDNGNLTKDYHKSNAIITYNHLDKPEIITTDQGTIYYWYDAAGNRLRKKVHTVATGKSDIYDYIGNFVYRNDTLQYISNTEGRARPVANPSGVTKFIYDYFVKDHLGNVRSTVTAEPITADYLARHEIATANVEQLVFDNIPNVRDTKPDGDGMAARLDGAIPNRMVGTAIMLKVMPGDRFNISADAYYEGEYQQSNVTGGQEIVESLMGALLNGNTYANVPVSELPNNMKTITQALGNPSLAGQLESLINPSNDPNAPKAHLNVLFFDDKLRLVPGNSSITQVPSVPMGGALTGFVTLTPNIQGGTMACCVSLGAGWVIVFVDNQSIGKDVWFDNIMIEHYTGKVQEETHYYPFGLTLQTSQEINYKDQPYKYNGKELEKSFGLEMYDYGARNYDPQIGRWNGVDPLAEQSRRWSPYTYCYNNPIRFVDPDGMAATDFYNLEGKDVKHVDDGKDDKKIVLTTSKKETDVNDAIKNGHVVNQITDEQVGQMDDIYKFAGTDKTKTEKGFMFGQKGKSSKIVTGNTKGRIRTAEWDEATEDLKAKNDQPASDVHLHPHEYDTEGRLLEYGAAEPSEADKDPASNSSYTQPSMILGYREEIEQLSANQPAGTPTRKLVPRVNFYNSNGTIITIDYKDFKRGVDKINKVK